MPAHKPGGEREITLPIAALATTTSSSTSLLSASASAPACPSRQEFLAGLSPDLFPDRPRVARVRRFGGRSAGRYHPTFSFSRHSRCNALPVREVITGPQVSKTH